MAKNEIEQKHHQTFEQIKQVNDCEQEFWSARELGKALEYAEYRNFIPVIEKAMVACQNSGQAISDHFVEVHEMIKLGKGGKRQIDSYALSRYACYLIVQNGDPTKPVIANGQTYFAVFQNHGYKGLYGGLDAKGIHIRKGLKNSEAQCRKTCPPRTPA